MYQMVSTHTNGSPLTAVTQDGDVVETDVPVAPSLTVPYPLATDVAWLWRALATGLLVVIILALAGIIGTILDGNDRTSPGVLVTIFSSALTGLIGLFVKAPDR